MIREQLSPRPNWQKRVEDAGCDYHTIDGKPYWCETAAYRLTLAEVDAIEMAADELHAMCLDHVDDVVSRGDYAGYRLTSEARQIIQDSWREHDTLHAHLYGRFDLGWGPDAALKMFEYNADTPTGLLEASILQWHALEDRDWPDQFNSIHEQLVMRWHLIIPEHVKRVTFTALNDTYAAREDWGNVHYLLATATEAGFQCSSLDLDQVGWQGASFRDMNDRPIDALFKLYPWEWMLREEFGSKVQLAQLTTTLIEPPWKMLLSNKALLPLLWGKHEGHPLLLEAYYDDDQFNLYRKEGDWVRKPLLGREGANVSIIAGDGRTVLADEKQPEYDGDGYVLQRKLASPATGPYPVLGSWVVGDTACGIGIREDDGVITTNASRFVPHYFVE